MNRPGPGQADGRRTAIVGRRIREERTKRLWSQKVTAARLRDAADEYTRTRLPNVENIRRRVRGHEAGQNHPGDLYAELYCRAFGLTRERCSVRRPRRGQQVRL